MYDDDSKSNSIREIDEEEKNKHTNPQLFYFMLLCDLKMMFTDRKVWQKHQNTHRLRERIDVTVFVVLKKFPMQSHGMLAAKTRRRKYCEIERARQKRKKNIRKKQQ